jgi:hypothetical protein
MQPWRDLAPWLKKEEAWLIGSIDGHPQKTMVLIAQDQEAERLGVAAVSHSAILRFSTVVILRRRHRPTSICPELAARS